MHVRLLTLACGLRSLCGLVWAQVDGAWLRTPARWRPALPIHMPLRACGAANVCPQPLLDAVTAISYAHVGVGVGVATLSLCALLYVKVLPLLEALSLPRPPPMHPHLRNPAATSLPGLRAACACTRTGGRAVLAGVGAACTAAHLRCCVPAAAAGSRASAAVARAADWSTLCRRMVWAWVWALLCAALVSVGVGLYLAFSGLRGFIAPQRW